MRNFSTTKFGTSFNAQSIEAVWCKASAVTGYDPSSVRMDACGALIGWGHYGNTSSQYGWEIDHIMPVARGGSDDISNLQPLQWQNNRHKGDNYPGLYCLIRAA